MSWNTCLREVWNISTMYKKLCCYIRNYIKGFVYMIICLIVEMVVFEEEGVTSMMMSRIYAYISMYVK